MTRPDPAPAVDLDELQKRMKRSSMPPGKDANGNEVTFYTVRSDELDVVFALARAGQHAVYEMREAAKKVALDRSHQVLHDIVGVKRSGDPMRGIWISEGREIAHRIAALPLPDGQRAAAAERVAEAAYLEGYKAGFGSSGDGWNGATPGASHTREHVERSGKKSFVEYRCALTARTSDDSGEGG